MKKKPGYKSYEELTEEDKEEIIQEYWKGSMKIEEMADHFKVVRRAVPKILKEAGIYTLRKNRYVLDENYFNKIDSEAKAYWLGYLYADGYVGDEHFNNIVFSQKISDGESIRHFARDIKFSGELRIVSDQHQGYDGEDALLINFSSSKMANDLRNLGLYPGKSTTMSELPPIEEKYIPHFIRGYFDGDGCISKYIRGYRVDGSERYGYSWDMIGTPEFLEKCAAYIPYEVRYTPSKSPEMVYIWNKYQADLPGFFHFLYDEATHFLSRKYNIWLEILGDLGAKVPEEKRDKPDEGCPAA